MINPKSISTLGIGFGSKSISTIGFIFYQDENIIITSDFYVYDKKFSPSFLSPTSFKIQFSKYISSNLFIQTVVVPQIRSIPIEINTTILDYHVTNTKLEFDPLVCTFIMDEDSNDFKSLMSWYSDISTIIELIESNTFNDANEIYRIQNKINELLCNAKLQIETDTGKLIEITFINIYPSIIELPHTQTFSHGFAKLSSTFSYEKFTVTY